MRATSSSPSTARSILTSKVSPTSSSSSTTTTKPRSRSRKRSCKQRACRSVLQLKGGQFFAAFGRINPTHPHTWDFADDPLVHGRFLGPDGLRGVGAQISWTLPVPWYSQLIFAVAKWARQHRLFISQPRRRRDFLRSHNHRSRSARAAGFRLDSALGKFGRSERRPRWCWPAFPARLVRTKPARMRARRFMAATCLYKWKSAHAEGGFPFVKWQTEVMYRRFEAGRGVDDQFPGGGNVSRLGDVFAGALGISKRLGRRRPRRLSPHAGFAIYR